MIPYFCAHCDTALPVYKQGKDLYENDLHLDLKRLGAYAPCAQVFAICVDHSADMTDDTMRTMFHLLQELYVNRACVQPCRSSVDITDAVRCGKIAALISVEGAERLDCSIEKLREAFELGLRIVHITWNDDNVLCGSCNGSGAGLSEQGRAFVKAAQALGVVLDMSHISEAGFWDTLEIAEKPVLAGHSDAMAVQKASRNLTDAQFEALVKTGGVAGLNFYPDFLGGTRDIDAILAHAEHFLSLGGEKSLCLGTDFDGIETTPVGIRGVQDMENLYNAMLRKNWSEQLVQDIFWNNLLQFFTKVI